MSWGSGIKGSMITEWVMHSTRCLCGALVVCLGGGSAKVIRTTVKILFLSF